MSTVLADFWEHLCTSFLEDTFVTCPPQNYSQSLFDQNMPENIWNLCCLLCHLSQLIQVPSEYFNHGFGHFKVFQGVSRLFQGISRRFRVFEVLGRGPKGRVSQWWLMNGGLQWKTRESSTIDTILLPDNIQISFLLFFQLSRFLYWYGTRKKCYSKSNCLKNANDKCAATLQV